MSRRLFGCALAGALMLAGCAAEPVVIDSHTDVTTRMAAIASRFEQARHEGGMAGAVADIEKCYATATLLVAKVFELRDCLVLDYVAYRTDFTIGRRLFGGPLPYFEDQVAAMRWVKYGKLAQFDSPGRLAEYLRNTNALVQADLAQMNAAPIVIHQPTAPHLASHL